jgi:hypothetical protein
MFIHEFDGLPLRGELDDNNKLWIPLHDVNRLRGVHAWKKDLIRAGLREDIDFIKVNIQTDEIAQKIWQYVPSRRRPHPAVTTYWANRPLSGQDENRPNGEPRARVIGGSPIRYLVSEGAMYRLMMRGSSKRDLILQHWLADEVIPGIREYGQYVLPTDHPVYAVLKDVSDELKVYRDIVWNSDLRLRDLSGNVIED